MDLYNKKMKVSKSKYILVFAAVFLCLVMAGTATATDGTTFPVDDAGIAAYVKVSESIELAKVVPLFLYRGNDYNLFHWTGTEQR